jgi:hypothetical protein
MTERDKALSFNWQADPTAFSFLGSAAFDKTVRSIVTEAYLLCRGDPEHGWISYSRRKAFYKSTRYRRTTYTYTTVVRAVDFLAREGWLEHRKMPQGNLGWQSSFRASPKLMAAIDPAIAIAWETTETIVLRDRTDKKRIEYRDTRDTYRMRRNLEAINEALSSVKIAHPDLGVISVGSPTKIGDANPGPARQTLSRVFNGNFEQGGRFYGAFWVSMPKQARTRLTIDGRQVQELDYKAIHPTLLYAEAGGVFHGDPYDIPGYPKAIRTLIKVAFNTMVNASNRKEAHWSILLRSRALTEAGEVPAGYCSPLAISALLDAIEDRHRPISKAFYSDAGVKLMRKDSILAERVMLDLARDNIVALPIHDSFITRAECASQLEEAMENALQSVLKTDDPSVTYSRHVSVSIESEISPAVSHTATVPHNGRRALPPGSFPSLSVAWLMAGYLPASDGFALILGASGILENFGSLEAA